MRLSRYLFVGALWFALTPLPVSAEPTCAKTPENTDTKFFYVEDCEECNQARLFLYRLRIPFREFNAIQPGVWKRLLDGPGQGRVPALYVCGEWFFGFDDDVQRRIVLLFTKLA